MIQFFSDLIKPSFIFVVKEYIKREYRIMPQAIDEKELIEQLHNQTQSREAFSVLVRQYSEPLYWQIRKMVLSHDDANDLLQNVFIKAWSGIATYRGEAKLSTWLHKIAINESLSFLKKQRAHRHLSIDDTDEFLLDNMASDPYFDADAADMRFQQAIVRLPEKQRLVFVMRYYDDMKYEEMAEVLSTTVGALKASYHHAHKKVTEFLTQED